jgi:hypothetical protein
MGNKEFLMIQVTGKQVKKVKRDIIYVVTILILLTIASSSEASWLIYHKPEFRGKVIDSETKQPIAGAVVVVVYEKTTMGLGAGADSSVINIRETLTDKEGIFRIPSYTTIILPFSWTTACSFIIYKPGYGDFPKERAYPPGMGLTEQEIFFSAGVEKTIYLQVMKKNMNFQKQVDQIFSYESIKAGIVELPKLKTKEERMRAMPGHITGWEDKTPILNRLMDAEDKALSFK